MRQISQTEVKNYVEENIKYFHESRLQSLSNLKLEKILKKKNPYLYKAKNLLTAHDMVKAVLDAHISSNEETIFGEWLEGLAIFINSKVYNGWKSGISGIDLEFDNEGARYIVNIKSGPNWGNGSAIKKMITDFNSARKTLRTSNSQLNVIAVNGCCYGRDNNPDKKGVYYKYCGQKFWEFISGNKNIYLDIIVPLGHKAKEYNEEYLISHAQIINQFSLEFGLKYCPNGIINWDAVVKLNSEMKLKHSKNDI